MSQFTRTIPHFTPPSPDGSPGEEFVITDKQWVEIERKAGGEAAKNKRTRSKCQLIYNSIPPAAREEVQAACRHYLDRVQMERESASIKEAIKYIEKIKQTSAAVNAARTAPSADVECWVGYLIDQISADAALGPLGKEARNRWRAFRADADALVGQAAVLIKKLDNALEYLDPHNEIRGRRKGESRDQLIVRLAEICKQHIHPNRAVQCGKGEQSEPSPFVRLYHAIADCVPQSWRPPRMSASAIAKVLKGAKGQRLEEVRARHEQCENRAPKKLVAE